MVYDFYFIFMLFKKKLGQQKALFLSAAPVINGRSQIFDLNYSALQTVLTSPVMESMT